MVDVRNVKNTQNRGVTQNKIILRHLRDIGTWTPTHDLVQRRTLHGYIGTHGDRRLRELRKLGLIEDRTVPGTNFKEWRLVYKEKPAIEYKFDGFSRHNQYLNKKSRQTKLI